MPFVEIGCVRGLVHRFGDNPDSPILEARLSMMLRAALQKGLPRIAKDGTSSMDQTFLTNSSLSWWFIP